MSNKKLEKVVRMLKEDTLLLEDISKRTGFWKYNVLSRALKLLDDKLKKEAENDIFEFMFLNKNKISIHLMRVVKEDALLLEDLSKRMNLKKYYVITIALKLLDKQLKQEINDNNLEFMFISKEEK